MIDNAINIKNTNKKIAELLNIRQKLMLRLDLYIIQIIDN